MRRFECAFGYPPGNNVVVATDTEAGREAVRMLTAAGIGGDLLDFYARVEHVSLPDIGNGYFIHPAEDVANGARNGQPTAVTGAVRDRITVFGSDGGGGLFALNAAGDKVYRLDEGSLIGSVYDVEDHGVDVVAADLEGFLEYLRDRVSETLPPEDR